MKAVLSASETRRKEFLPYYQPVIAEEAVKEVIKTLREGKLTAGKKVGRFEDAIATYVSSCYAVAINSGANAARIALMAQGIGQGDEVVITPLNAYSTIESIEAVGAIPLMVDIDPATGNIDVNKLEMALTAKTRAIIPFHYAGRASEMNAVMDIAARYGLFVLEDATFAVGAEYRGQRIGSVGHAGVFRLGANHQLTTGEGGIVVTDDTKLFDRMRAVLSSVANPSEWQLSENDTAINGAMNELQAAIGIGQLSSLDEQNIIRRKYARIYTEALYAIPELMTPEEETLPGNAQVWSLYPLGIIPDRLQISRSAFVEALRTEHIGASVPQVPIHLHQNYLNRFDVCPGDFPNAEAFAKNTVLLPLYPRMAERDLFDVVNAVIRIVRAYRK